MNQDRYIKQYSSSQGEVLDWLERQTNLRTNHSRMLCGIEMGRLLQYISLMLKPMQILEIGTFTGYSAICLSAGLQSNGQIDTIEINDELSDLILDGFNRAGISDQVNLHLGDAKAIIPTLSKQYDLVLIDANKREYVEYYDLVIDKVRSGGFIVADNVLWSGKVYADNPPTDAQTEGIMQFNQHIVDDSRVDNIILPIRDGINLIRKL